MITCRHGISAFSISAMQTWVDGEAVCLRLHCPHCEEPYYWILLDTLCKWKLECVGTFGGGDKPSAGTPEQ